MKYIAISCANILIMIAVAGLTYRSAFHPEDALWFCFLIPGALALDVVILEVDDETHGGK